MPPSFFLRMLFQKSTGSISLCLSRQNGDAKAKRESKFPQHCQRVEPAGLEYNQLLKIVSAKFLQLCGHDAWHASGEMGPALGSDEPALPTLPPFPRCRQDGNLLRRLPVHHRESGALPHPGSAVEK